MTHKRLPNVDFVPHAPAMVGSEVNVNHEDCPAGVDRKRRLYIKRVDAGIVAYCHHCGMAGYFLPGKSRMRYSKHVTLEPPKDGTTFNFADLGAVPIGIKNGVWLEKYISFRHKNLRDAVKMYLHEASKVDGSPIIFPIQNRHSGIDGWQLRWTDGRLPKTKTYLNTKPHSGSWLGTDSAENLLIVEDPLSAVICKAELGTNWKVLCLLGTNLTGTILASILATNKERVYIWMDPDDPGKVAAAKLRDRLVFAVHVPIYTVNAPKQPKEQPDIMGALRDYV